jgi:hypothetical protein
MLLSRVNALKRIPRSLAPFLPVPGSGYWNSPPILPPHWTAIRCRNPTFVCILAAAAATDVSKEPTDRRSGAQIEQESGRVTRSFLSVVSE